MPKISVVTQTYNHEKYVRECIESVLCQTCRDFEYIVVDDGSTDNTPDIIKSFGNSLKSIRQENRGAVPALNTAIKNATGEYIAWLASDDVFMPMKLEEQVRFMEANSDVDVSYTDYYVIDGNGDVIREVRSPYYEDKRDFLWNMLKGNFINGSSIMFKRSCLDTVGYFDEQMKYHADGNMWFRMLKQFKFGHVSKTLLKYRWHETNMSHHRKNMKSYLHIYYEKVFDLYDPKELVPGSPTAQSATLKIAKVLLSRYGLYSLAFSKLVEGLRPFSAQGAWAFLSFFAMVPARVLLDFRTRIMP